MKSRKISTSLSFFLFVGLILLNFFKSNAQANCQNEELQGSYIHIKDSDGNTPKKGATVTLTLSDKNVNLHAIMPDDELEASGEFYACRNLIVISIADLGINVTKKPFTHSGNTLILPFLALGGEGEGTSTWQKVNKSDNIKEDDDEGDDDVDVDDDQNDENITNPDNDSDDKDDNGDIDKDDDGDDNSKDDQENNNTDKNQNLDKLNKPDNQYIGEYYGIGRGWEVRFKHTSGEFVSQFTGKKGELPFGNDKVIMSLMVEHATSFKINIDEYGNVTGDGEIVYNLIPNLCGVAILTEQVNTAVNLMGEFAFFLDMSGKIGQASVQKFEGAFLGMEGQLAKTMKISADQGLSLVYEYLGTKLPEKMKALDLEAQQGTALCNCASGQASISGGNAVGPSTIKELVSTFGVDVAKTLFMDVATGSLPVGLVLSIPGVTQIQYYYKGLQNGPETRRFDIKGKLVNGELFLEMDGDVYDGPKQLTIEYMVNYKKETPTFPTWSPFLQKGGKMYPAGSEATTYEFIEKTKTVKFKDAATGETKTLDIPYTETNETKVTLPFPFASFREAGNQRNGVKVWHEYEYNWSVYKAPPEK